MIRLAIFLYGANLACTSTLTTTKGPAADKIFKTTANARGEERIVNTGLRKSLITLLLLLPFSVHGSVISSLLVFGDSLSDSGNAGILTGGVTTPTPISGNTFIPDFPYDRGLLPPALSNGPIWIEQFAAELGLPLTPSLAGGNDFAVGGSRMGSAGGNPFTSVSDSVAAFVMASDVTAGEDLPSDALYVIWGGGNDARDALFASPGPIIDAYVVGLLASIDALIAEGAQKFLIPNVPDIGKTPAVEAFGAEAAAGATALVGTFNAAAAPGLAARDGIAGVNIIEFDVFSLIGAAATFPSAFGLTNSDDACAASAACIAAPEGHLFWDGIHPTTKGHSLLAQGALRLVPEPGTTVLFASGLVLLALRRNFRAQ